MTTLTSTKAPEPTLTPKDVQRLFGDGYREIEVMPDGRVREASQNGDLRDEAVTRTLKTERTWYCQAAARGSGA
jgi:hypothetical protein